MARTQDIIFGVTSQSVTERILEARPTSATFKVFADTETDDATPRFTGTATVDSVNTTVDAASGPSQAGNEKKVNLTSTSGIQKGRKYLLSEESMEEWAEVTRIVTDDYVLVRHPLKNNYTTAATFVSTTISMAIDATWVADSDNISDQENPFPDWRVRSLVVMPSGPNLVYTTYFDLVRVPVQSDVTLADLDLRFPGIIDKIDADLDSEQGKPLIDESWRALRAEWAARADLNDASLRDTERMREAHILMALRMAAESGLYPAQYGSLGDYIEVTRTNFERYFEAAYLLPAKNAISTGTGGGASYPAATAIWSK